VSVQISTLREDMPGYLQNWRRSGLLRKTAEEKIEKVLDGIQARSL
jgi:hypothetical protein